MQTGTTFENALAQFFETRRLNKKPKTLKGYADLEKLMRANCPSFTKPVHEIETADVIELARAFEPQCETRWNLMVAAVRFCLPQHARLLKRRPVKLRQFVPPGQLEFDRFLGECDKLAGRSHVGLVARFLCFTGMRKGEAYAVRWANVGDTLIHVPASYTKNGLGRAVPIVDDLPPVLDKLRALEWERNDSFVLPPESCRRALKTASLAALGVPWSAHLCRHLFATRAIAAGVDMPTVARWLGHLDGGALLAKTYFHLGDEHSLCQAKRLRFAPSAIA